MSTAAMAIEQPQPFSFTMRLFLKAAGVACLIMGIIGIAIPFIPGTPLIMLSAYCFSKASE
jgi:uncharacterized membrane protein YbaN (DUF454 family)